MSLEEFLKLAAQMREAQKQFTATQQMADEEKARKLERSFDRVLLEVMGRYVLGMAQLPGFTELSDPSRRD